MLLVASRNSRVPPIEMHILRLPLIWNDTTHLPRSSDIHTYMYVHVYTDCFPDPADFCGERGARSRNVVIVATERKEGGRRNDMHRKIDLPKRKHCMCECVWVFKR
ncbi:hypothetical protein CAJAP_03533 [Camponotus japonicus]